MLNYAYITKEKLGCGEILIEGRNEGGEILFGFKTYDDGFCSWREKARDYTPSKYIPVFQPNVPARMVV